MQTNSSNRGPVINIINWIVMVLMCLAALSKVSAKYVLIRNLQYDDVFTVLAMIFAIGYGVAVTYQTSAGLGQHMNVLTTWQINRYQQAVYASQIMYAISLSLAKQVILQLFVILSRNSARRYAVYTIMGTNLALGLAVVFSISFQCSLPDTWAILSPPCFEQRAFWKAFAGFDVAMDLAIAGLAVLLFCDLNMAVKVKVPVILAFSSRIFLLPIIIFRVMYVIDTLGSSDRSYADITPMIFTTTHINSSVIITCIPFLKPILNGLQSGILAGDIRSLAPLGSSAYLFSSAHRRASELELKSSKSKPDIKHEGEGESRENMNEQTREVDIVITTPNQAVLNSYVDP